MIGQTMKKVLYIDLYNVHATFLFFYCFPSLQKAAHLRETQRNNFYAFLRFLRKPNIAKAPMPKRARVEGSGTGAGARVRLMSCASRVKGRPDECIA